MGLLQTIKYLNQCLLFPYLFILVAILILNFFLKQKRIFDLLIVFFVFFTWRLFFKINASRYFSSCIILFFLGSILFLKAYKGRKYNKAIFVIIFTGLTVFNYIDVFHSFNNVYVFDLRDGIKKIVQSGNKSVFFIEEKEFKRVAAKENTSDTYRIIQEQIESLNSYDKAKTFLKSYSLFSQTIYLAVSDKNNIISNVKKELDLDIKKIQSYKTNKKNKRLNLYCFNTEHKNDPEKTLSQDNNLISNGDCEILQTGKEKVKQLKNWIDQGASFYAQETILLPKSKIIVPIFSPYKEDSFIEAYAEKNKPINGDSSLHLRFKPGNTLPVYMFNHVPSLEGVFSFSAMSLNDNKVFKIFFHSYSDTNNGATVPKYSTFYFMLEKNKVYNIQIKVDKEMLYGDRMIFLLYAEDIDLILDDVSFIPNEAS